MRKFFPGTRLVITSTLLLVLPVFAIAAENNNEQLIAKGVSEEYMKQNLRTHRTVYLRQMIKDSDKRSDYVKRLYYNQKLEQTIVKEGLDPGQPLLETLRIARERALFNTLIGYEFGKMEADLEALAAERFAANPNKYNQVRKKIKIALIYIQKNKGMEEWAKKEVEEIAAQLNAQPENTNLFYDLAEQNSDDVMAFQGGVNKKWLIAPNDLEKSKPVLQAAFALETPGQMTDIVESERGYSIVRLLKVTEGIQLGYEAVKGDIIAEIISELQKLKKVEIMQSLEAPDDFPIEDDVVARIISDMLETRVTKAQDQ